MERCNNCGAEVVSQMRFCGRCGQPTLNTLVMPQSTSGQGAPTVYPPQLNRPAMVRETPAPTDLRAWMAPGAAEPGHDEGEKEQRKQGLTPPPVLPLPGLEGASQVGQVPMAQGIPHIGGAPVAGPLPQLPVSTPNQPIQGYPSNMPNQPVQSYPPNIANQPVRGYPSSMPNQPMQGHSASVANQPAHGYPSNMPNQPVQGHPAHVANQSVQHPQMQGPAHQMQAPHGQAPHLANHPISQVGKAVNRPRIPGLRTATSKIVAGSVAAVVVVAVIVATMHRNGPAGPGGGGAAFFAQNGQGISGVRLDGSGAWSFNKSNTSFNIGAGGPPAELQGVIYLVGTPTPGVNGGTSASQKSDLYAVKATDGSLLWTVHLDDVGGPPTAYKGGIYVQVGQYIEAFRPGDGSLLWKAPTNGGGQRAVDAISDSGVYVIGDLRTGGNCLYAFSRSDGKLLWRYAASILDKVVYDQGSVYMVDGQGVGGGGAGGASGSTSFCPADTTVDHTTSHVYALNASNGTPNWTFSLGGEMSSSADIVVTNGTIYVEAPVGGVTGATSHVFALQASNGTQLWDHNVGDHGFSGSLTSGLTIENGIVCFGNYINKTVYALQASTGVQLWAFPTPLEASTPFALTRGIVYVQGQENNAYYLYALQASTGAQLWKVANAITTGYVSTGQVPGAGQPVVQYQIINGAIYRSGVSTSGQAVAYPLINGDGTLIPAAT